YRYVGKERDEETGLYYYGARYYAPWLARFTSTDLMGMVDGASLYSYVKNNPIKLNDPDGMQAGGEDEEEIKPIDTAIEGDPDKGKVKTSSDKGSYVVKKGDTLSEIAEDNDI